MRARHVLLLTAIVLSAVAFAYFIRSGAALRLAFEPTASTLPSGASLGDGREGGGGAALNDGVYETEDGVHADAAGVSVLASGLEIPWEVAFLPNDDLLVTERPGRLVRIGKEGGVINVRGVRHVGEGGLLGLALHPDFERNHYVYLYLTSAVEGGLMNRVDRYVLNGDELTDATTVLSGIPGAVYHDGGRIAFGPDGMLYVTTGDAGYTGNARRTDSLAGKILRITDTGEIPPDNPFGNAVWSYGHRNPQGIDFDGDGVLWSVEHGRSGVRTGMDEVNVIERGADYGWPEIEGDVTMNGMRVPIVHSGPNETWAPGDIAWLEDGIVLFTGLRGEALYEGRYDATGNMRIIAHFRGDFGRLRAVAVAPDGHVVFTTSNRDGRGTTSEDDDRVIHVDRAVFLGE